MLFLGFCQVSTVSNLYFNTSQQIWPQFYAPWEPGFSDTSYISWISKMFLQLNDFKITFDFYHTSGPSTWDFSKLSSSLDILPNQIWKLACTIIVDVIFDSQLSSEQSAAAVVTSFLCRFRKGHSCFYHYQPGLLLYNLFWNHWAKMRRIQFSRMLLPGF